MGLPSNLSEQIAGLDKVVEREKQREKVLAAVASGQSIKTTDRDTKENRKVLTGVLVVMFLLVAGVAVLVVRGLLAGPTPEELASLNGWAAQEMDQALKMITTQQVRSAAGNSVPTDAAQKRKIIETLLREKFTQLQAKTEKEIGDVVNSSSNKSQETLLHNRRALELLQTGKDAYGQPWRINFDADDYVMVQSIGANHQDDSGPTARVAKKDDQIVSYYIPFVPPPPPTVAVAPPPPPPGGDTLMTVNSPALQNPNAVARHTGSALEDSAAYQAYQKALQEKGTVDPHAHPGATPPPPSDDTEPVPQNYYPKAPPGAEQPHRAAPAPAPAPAPTAPAPAPAPANQ